MNNHINNATTTWLEDKFLVNSNSLPEVYIGTKELLSRLQNDMHDFFPKYWKLYDFDVHVETKYGKRYVFEAKFKYKRQETQLRTEVPFDQVARLLRTTAYLKGVSTRILDYVKSEKFKYQREGWMEHVNYMRNINEKSN